MTEPKNTSGGKKSVKSMKSDYGSHPKVKKPDEAEFKKKVNAERDIIKELRSKLDNYVDRIKVLNESKEQRYNEFVERKDHINTIQSQMNDLLAQKNSIMEQLEAKQREMKQADTSSGNRKNQVLSDSSIDKKIESIEKQIITSTLSLKEEKRLVAEIEALQITKANNAKQASKAANAKSSDGALNDEKLIASLKEQLEKIEGELYDLRTIRTKEFQLLGDKNAQDIIKSELSKLIEGRNELKEQLRTHTENRGKIYNEWNDAMRDYNELVAKYQADRVEKIREQQQKRNAEMERIGLQNKLEEAEELPENSDLMILEQLLKYVEKLAEDKKRTRESLEELKQVESANGSTMHHKDANIRTKKSQVTKRKSNAVRFDVQTLAYFSQFGIEVPFKEESINECLAEINGRIKTAKAKFDAAKEAKAADAANLQAQLLGMSRVT